MKTEKSKVNKVETRIMAIKIKVNRVISCKDQTRIITRGKGIVRRLETLANRHPRRVILRTRPAGNVERIISGNAVREPQCATSVVKRVILLEDALPRPQMITDITGIKTHSLNPFKL